jgi:SurA N-terminal domain
MPRKDVDVIRKPRAVLAAIGLAAALGLSGCGALGAAGTAAEVGDQTISVGYLQKQVESIVEMAGRKDATAAEVSNTQRAVLINLVEQRLILDAAATAEVEATPAEISKVVAEIKRQGAQVPPDMLDGFAEWNLLNQKLATKLLGHAPDPASQEDQTKAQQLVSAEIGKVGVKINPRYGSWNGTTITPEGGELVKVTPEEGLAPEAPAGS